MRTFNKPDWGKDESHVCPICKGREVKPIVLIPIQGTQEGHNAQAKFVHEDCLEKGLWYYPDNNIILINCNDNG